MEDNMKNLIAQVKQEYKLQQVEEEWAIFLEIANSIQPKVIVEIGAFRGGSAACFAKISKTVVSIDEWIGRVNVDKIKQACEYHYINADSHSDEAIQELKSALNGRQIDVLFIDGDHTYKGAKRDFNMYKHLVRAGGIIGLHDILESDHHKKLSCHVYKFWTELQQSNYNTQTISYDKDWGGIGVIRL